MDSKEICKAIQQVVSKAGSQAARDMCNDMINLIKAQERELGGNVDVTLHVDTFKKLLQGLQEAANDVQLTDNAPKDNNKISMIFNPVCKTSRIKELAEYMDEIKNLNAVTRDAKAPTNLNVYEQIVLNYIILRARTNFEEQRKRISEDKPLLRQGGRFKLIDVMRHYGYGTTHAELYKKFNAAVDSLVNTKLLLLTNTGAIASTILAMAITRKREIEYIINNSVLTPETLNILAQYYDVAKLTHGKLTAEKFFKITGKDSDKALAVRQICLELIRELNVYKGRAFSFKNVIKRFEIILPHVAATKDLRRSLRNAFATMGYAMEISDKNKDAFLVWDIKKHCTKIADLYYSGKRQFYWMECGIKIQQNTIKNRDFTKSFAKTFTEIGLAMEIKDGGKMYVLRKISE